VRPGPQRQFVQRLGDDRAGRGLDGHREDRLALFLQITCDPGERAARAHACHHRVHGAFAIVPDFRAGSFLVNRRVGRIGELLWHVVMVRRAGDDLLGAGNRAPHALRAVGEHQFRPHSLEDLAALNGHGFGHGERDPVAARRRHEGQRNARVPAGRLYDLATRLEQTALFRVPDHGSPDAALDRVGRIAAFNLGDHRAVRALGHPVQPDERRVADAQ